MRLELTREGDYAVRAMLALADADPADLVSRRRIAEEWEIPPRFLKQVLAKLAGSGLVVATTGRRGGYRLARPLADIGIMEIVEAIDGPTDPTRCVLRGGPCRPDGRCRVHEVFALAQARYLETLTARTLADIEPA